MLESFITKVKIKNNLIKLSQSNNNLLIFFVLFMIPVWCIAKPTATQKLFLDTEKNIQQNKIKTIKEIPEKLVKYSLYPYLEFNLLKNKFNQNPVSEINSFYKKYKDQPVSKKLNYYYVSHLASNGKWYEIIDAYQENNSTKLACLYTTAKQHVNQMTISQEEVENLWLYGKSRPKECDSLFATWLENKTINKKLIWERIYLAMENNNAGLVNYLGKNLPEDDYNDIKLWTRVHGDSSLIKKTSLFNKNNKFHQKILVHGLQKQAALNIDRSLRYFRELNLAFKFTKENKYKYYKFLATRMYLRDHKLTENIIKQIPYEYYDEKFHEIAVKNALKIQDWHLVLKRIKKIPIEQRKDDIWIYWQARAFDELKKPNIAKTMFLSIANKTNYYGLMACNNLNQFCPIEFAITKPFQADKRKLLQDKNIRRAIELYSLGRHNDARVEWNYAIKQLDDKDKFIAANIANELNWHDRSIVTAAIFNKEQKQAKESQNDANKSAKPEKTSTDFLHLEYPLGYKNLINKYAKKYKVDPALIYAISRQESHFNRTAKSSAGAMGVMQLMPTTARKVAKDYKIPYQSKWNLLKKNTNISLGSAYLQQMLDDYNGNMVLAAAAYNAGPHRVKKWTENIDSIATDIWVELVPFKETRNYLKKIITNTAIYRSRLGKPPVQLSEVIPLNIENN